MVCANFDPRTHRALSLELLNSSSKPGAARFLANRELGRWRPKNNEMERVLIENSRTDGVDPNEGIKHLHGDWRLTERSITAKGSLTFLSMIFSLVV